MADGVEKLGSEMVGKSCGHVGFISRESLGKFTVMGLGVCIRGIPGKRRSLIGSLRLYVI